MSPTQFDVSVIVTTYNQPEWLEKVIWGYSIQTHRRFEIVIADDGSTAETRSMIDRLRALTGLTLRHVWHEDQGFRKCKIVNKAIAEAAHDYLVFTDGDCVPCLDFLETHVRLAEKGAFLSGGYVRLPLSISQRLSCDDVRQGRAGDLRWLRQQGMPLTKSMCLLTRNKLLGMFLDSVTTTRPTFNGHNSSVWKCDAVRVNGLDERMQYGGLDREFGERLENSGIQGKQVRHRAGCIHLDHPRPYSNREDLQRNEAIREMTVRTGRAWTDFGIENPREATASGASSDLHAA
jgi:glycosyltransferase involved in cell wall biosynthesis